MSAGLLLKLLAVFAVIGVGWLSGRLRVLGPGAATTLGAAAFGVFTPALLFRTTAHVDLAKLPWATIVAYYGPTVVLMFAAYAWQRLRHPPRPEVPAVRALSLSFSNTVQLGIPVATALFGPAGLTLHLALASLQALVLLTTGTMLAEVGRSTGRWVGAALVTLRRAFIHPVVLPILLGLAFNASGLPIPGPVDDVLVTLGQAVVPVSLVTIGLTLAQYGVAGTAGRAVTTALGKLVVQPAAVFPVAYWLLGLRGLPLTVAVMCAALPIGANVLLFAQRYEVLEAEVTGAIVTSTVAYLVTGTLWLLLLTHLAA
ncbi:MAG TPA: AEC family transporter [Rugosimonospora sp.]|nr:AEC family transporter [Rugosimonospora sp.]